MRVNDTAYPHSGHFRPELKRCYRARAAATTARGAQESAILALDQLRARAGAYFLSTPTSRIRLRTTILFKSSDNAAWLMSASPIDSQLEILGSLRPQRLRGVN